MIRIVIADDDLLVREGIERVLAAEPEIDVVAVSKDRGELMAAIERESPDVVVTDIRMRRRMRARAWRSHRLSARAPRRRG